MLNLELCHNNQSLTVMDNDNQFVNRSRNYHTLIVHSKITDNVTSEVSKYAQFSNRNGVYQCILHEIEEETTETEEVEVETETEEVTVIDYECTIPEEVMTENSFYVMVYTGDRLTTNRLKVSLGQSGYSSDIQQSTSPDDIITWIVEELNDKAELVHTHIISDVTGLETILNGKSDLGHNHSTSDVNGLNDALNNKANAIHTHTKSNITDFGHTHTKSEVTDFNHTHVKADVTDFSHTHGANELSDSNAYVNLDISANSTQQQINNAINTKIGALLNIDMIEVVTELPTASADTMNKFYLIAKSTQSTGNNFEIYFTVQTGADTFVWERSDDAELILSDYVRKETGKGLSSNDFTNALLSKLNGIEAEANKTTVDSALNSQSSNPVQNSTITAKFADYYTKNETYTKSEIDTLIGNIEEDMLL